ncbi:MAG: serine hydrolase domain-containing protein [Flavobacteriales bacterium]
MRTVLRFFGKFFKWTLIALGVLLILANAFILISGRTYIYKAVACTYLVGQSGPGILDLEYFPKREVANQIAEPWPVHPDYASAKLLPEQQKILDQYKSTSFLIFRRDTLVLEYYTGGFDEHTVSNSFSMAKSLVSLLCGIAIDEGKIKGVDQPVSDFIPSFAEGEKSKLTLWHLLTMSAATDWSESGGNPLSHNAEAYYGWDLEGMIEDTKVEGEPGKKFYYQSGITLILGYCVYKATGVPLAEYASEKVWKNIGAEQPAYWSLDKEGGLEKSYCCLYATGRDFARLGKLYMHAGAWNGKRIVSSDWVQQSITPAELIDEDGSKNQRYGYQWWITQYEGKKVFYMRGILGQYVICYPEEDLIIVRTGHKRGRKQNDTPVEIDDYIRIAKEVTNAL